MSDLGDRINKRGQDDSKLKINPIPPQGILRPEGEHETMGLDPQIPPIPTILARLFR